MVRQRAVNAMLAQNRVHAEATFTDVFLGPFDDRRAAASIAAAPNDLLTAAAHHREALQGRPAHYRLPKLESATFISPSVRICPVSYRLGLLTTDTIVSDIDPSEQKMPRPAALTSRVGVTDSMEFLRADVEQRDTLVRTKVLVERGSRLCATVLAEFDATAARLAKRAALRKPVTVVQQPQAPTIVAYSSTLRR